MSHCVAEGKADTEAPSAVLGVWECRYFLQQQSDLKEFLLQVTATLCHSLSQSEEPLLQSLGSLQRNPCCKALQSLLV